MADDNDKKRKRDSSEEFDEKTLDYIIGKHYKFDHDIDRTTHIMEERDLYPKELGDDNVLLKQLEDDQRTKLIICKDCKKRIGITEYFDINKPVTCPNPECGKELILTEYCPICHEYVEKGIECPNCKRWYHYECTDFTEYTIPKNWTCS